MDYMEARAQADAEYRHFRDVVIPARQRYVAEKFSELLPAGFTFEFVDDLSEPAEEEED